MTIGVCFQLGIRRRSIRNPSSIVRSWFAMPMRTWPSTNVGAPLAWKETKSSGVPIFAGRVIRAAQAVLEEVAHERAAAAGDVRSADARRRQRAAHGVDRVVVQLVEFLRRAAPVADVRLVPHLPVPRLDFARPYRSTQCFDPLVDELAPLRVVLRRIGPAGEDLVVPGRGVHVVLIRLRLRRQRLRHEADLRVRPDAALQIRVEDAIEDRPVVDRLALLVLACRRSVEPHFSAGVPSPEVSRLCVRK